MMKTWTKVLACVAMVGLVAAAYGFGEHGKKEGKKEHKHAQVREIEIPLKMVPPAVKEAALKKFPGIVLKEAELEIEGNEIEFTLEGMLDGKEVEIEVEAVLKITEVEREKDGDKDDDDDDKDHHKHEHKDNDKHEHQHEH